MRDSRGMQQIPRVTAPLVALLVFLVLQLGIGVWVSRRIATEDDYLVAGRRMGTVLTTGSLFATWFGAETVIGSAGRVREEGVTLASAEPFGYGLCLVLGGALLARPLWARGLTTLADLYRQRFGVGVERLAAVLLIPSSVLWAAAQVRAFGQVIAATGELSVAQAIAVAALFTIAYTAVGGLLADAVTDVLQGGILAAGLLVMGGAVVVRVGGVEAAVHQLVTSPVINLTPQAAGHWLDALEAWAIPVVGSLTATEIVGRLIGARSPAVAQRGALLAGTLYIAVGLIPVVIALLAAPLVPSLADPEQLLPVVARQLLPPLLFAVFTGGLVSAILSTVDSTLLVASGLLSHNLVVPLAGITAERHKLWVARGGVVTLGGIAYLLAIRADGVFHLVETASAFGSAGVVVTVLGALFTPWGSARTAAATLLGGVAGYLGAVGAGVRTPFLASLLVAVLLWTAGCLLEQVGRSSPAMRREDAPPVPLP
jgi:Na+/proline symporter